MATTDPVPAATPFTNPQDAGDDAALRASGPGTAGTGRTRAAALLDRLLDAVMAGGAPARWT